MLEKLNELIDLKKWVEGHIVAGVATASTAAAGWLAAHNAIEMFAKFGITVTVDAEKFQGAVLVLIAGIGGSIWNAARKKTVERTNS